MAFLYTALFYCMFITTAAVQPRLTEIPPHTLWEIGSPNNITAQDITAVQLSATTAAVAEFVGVVGVSRVDSGNSIAFNLVNNNTLVVDKDEGFLFGGGSNIIGYMKAKTDEKIIDKTSEQNEQQNNQINNKQTNNNNNNKIMDSNNKQAPIHNNNNNNNNNNSPTAYMFRKLGKKKHHDDHGGGGGGYDNFPFMRMPYPGFFAPPPMFPPYPMTPPPLYTRPRATPPQIMLPVQQQQPQILIQPPQQYIIPQQQVMPIARPIARPLVDPIAVTLPPRRPVAPQPPVFPQQGIEQGIATGLNLIGELLKSGLAFGGGHTNAGGGGATFEDILDLEFRPSEDADDDFKENDRSRRSRVDEKPTTITSDTLVCGGSAIAVAAQMKTLATTKTAGTFKMAAALLDPISEALTFKDTRTVMWMVMAMVLTQAKL
eukprot:GHVS01079004.1.p1 GENE.GHVS01079004.1~~GHVS01079004.1.p1  ORF type:complete len:430 (+),score=112.78 GHVS01079004.1:291-1580(+)